VSRPLLVAHQGGAWLAESDVVEGVRQLVEVGVDAVEFDVRRTADNTLVVHHDAEWNGLRLDRVTYKDLVRRGTHIRTLDDVLAVAGDSLALDVELKETGYEADVVVKLLTHVENERLVVTSFLDQAILAVKTQVPTVRVGLLVGRRRALREPRTLWEDAFPFERLRRCKADFLAPNLVLLALALRWRAHRQDTPVLLWTVHNAKLVRRYLRDTRLLGVVTDSPAALRTTRSDGRRPTWPFP
jgi:glycerophosphoryl diester phosphodiesterase